MTDEERTPPTEPRLELVPPRRPPPAAVGARTGGPGRDHPARQPHPTWALWLGFVSDTAVEYVGLLGAAVARLREAGRGTSEQP